MSNITLSDKEIQQIIDFQRNEITEFHLYKRLASITRNENNKQTLLKIAEDEYRHYDFWKSLTKTDVRPNVWMLFKFFWIARFLGLTFGIKLMEKGEAGAQLAYEEFAKTIPEAAHIMDDEDEHEKQLIDLIEEKKLDYVGSVVLGLNDALVELTGALAGLTFALQNTRLIALAGLITGIAASFSMAASEYLSTKSEDGKTSGEAFISSLYTGGAYIITVMILIMPYLVIENYFLSLGFTLFFAVLIILIFNYYIAIAKDLNFKKRFTEMAAISLGVSAFSFGIGFIIRQFLGVEI